MEEGPPPPDMIPGLRNLIARLEGYEVNDSTGRENYMMPDYLSNDKLDTLAIMLMVNDNTEKIDQLEKELGENQALTGLLVFVNFFLVAATIYLFVSR